MCSSVALVELIYLFYWPCQVMLRNSAGALKDFERAISLSPYSAHMYFNRANLHTSLKDYQKAETDYSKGESIVTADVMHQSM